jgi:hypothetical protein
MILTLTVAEEAALMVRYPALKIDDAIHALLKTIVKEDSEGRLQSAASLYRSLSLDKQVEATELLKTWAAAQTPPVV